MNSRRLFSGLGVSVVFLAAASPAFGLANRVFVSARSGNNANSCDNIATPCQTLQGAINQLNPNGEAIVLDSGGYGAVTISQGVTIEAAAGVTAFIHPASGDAITINGGANTVTLRGLVLNVGTGIGIKVNNIGTLNVENCFISGFALDGIRMVSTGKLNVKETTIKGCNNGIVLNGIVEMTRASIDHCHLDANLTNGFVAQTTSAGSSSTIATYSTANGNGSNGWVCGASSDGMDVLNLEFCSGSENAGGSGLFCNSTNVLSVASYSTCAFVGNGAFGVDRNSSGVVQTRGNNTLTGNGVSSTHGVIGTFPPM